jgi:hypothetical protein
MPKLKAYTAETCDSFVPSFVIEALGVRSHHRQARVLIFAPTKRRAAELAEASHLFGWHRNANGQRWLRLAMGNDLDALTPHFGAEEGILALPTIGSGSADGNVVRVLGQLAAPVGRLEHAVTPQQGSRFVPAPSESFFVRRERTDEVGGQQVGWVGPISSERQAGREVGAWRGAGWQAVALPDSEPVRRTVQEWQAAAIDTWRDSTDPSQRAQYHEREERRQQEADLTQRDEGV